MPGLTIREKECVLHVNASFNVCWLNRFVFFFLNLVKLFSESCRIFLLKDCFHVLWFLLLFLLYVRGCIMFYFLFV